MNEVEIKTTISTNAKWEEDRYGNVVHSQNGVKLRLHFGVRKVRLERQIVIPASEYSKEQKIWVLVASDFYKNVVVTTGKSGKQGIKIDKKLILLGGE